MTDERVLEAQKVTTAARQRYAEAYDRWLKASVTIQRSANIEVYEEEVIVAKSAYAQAYAREREAIEAAHSE